MKSFADFMAESDSEDSRLQDDRGRGGTLGDLKRPSQPLRPLSASTAASEEGMMIGGVKVRMPGPTGPSRPTSASSTSTLSRPTSAVSGARWQPPGTETVRERSKSPAPDPPKQSMRGLGPVDTLQGRSKSPAPDQSPKQGLLGLGPVDSLRGRSKPTTPDQSPKQGLLGLGPVDSLPGRSKPTTPDQSPSKQGIRGLGPVDSLSGRSKSPAPDPFDHGRVPAPWEHASRFGSRDAPFPPGASSPAMGGPLAPSAPKTLRPGSAARTREVSGHSWAPPPPMAPMAMSPPSPDDFREDWLGEGSIESLEEVKKKKDKKDKKEKKEKKSKKEKKEKKEQREQREQREREEEEKRLQKEMEDEKRARKERKKEEKRLQKKREKEEKQKSEVHKKEHVTFEDSGDDRSPAQASPRPSRDPRDVAAPAARPKQSQLKTGRPRLRRFLLNFDPLGLTVVWEKNGHRQATALRVDPDDLTNVSSQRNFAKRLVKKWEFLQEHHRAQVEALLQRLAQRVLPIYRIEPQEALGTWEAPGRPAKEPLFLPPGLLFLVVERTRCADGWWLRLASGKRWVPEKIKDRVVCISCKPSTSEATESLRSLRLDKKPSSVVERNVRLVCSQLSKSAALR